MTEQEQSLLDSTQTITTIICTECANQEEVKADKEPAIKQFIEKGWRATAKRIYCPECELKRKRKNT